MRSVDWDRHSDDEKTKFFYRLKDEDQKTYGVCRIFSDYSHKKRSFAAIICGDCRRNEWDGKCHPIRIENLHRLHKYLHKRKELILSCTMNRQKINITNMKNR